VLKSVTLRVCVFALLLCSVVRSHKEECALLHLKLHRNKVCICVHADTFILPVKNPELQPPAVHPSEGVRWTQVSPSAVSIHPDVYRLDSFCSTFL